MQQSVLLLIAMAREKVHTDGELAQRIGCHPVALAQTKAGKRPVTPETVCELCEVVGLPGEEAREWVALSVIDNPKNEKRRARLSRILFRQATDRARRFLKSIARVTS